MKHSRQTSSRYGLSIISFGIATITLIMLSLVLFTGCSTHPENPWQSSGKAAAVQSPTEGLWWQDRVFYEIFVRSFYDSDGDGIGDLNGITERLDYLNDGDPATTSDLGVTGIWLMPIMASPSYHGYDVTDYYSVNPDYGTIDDLKNLIAEAHKRGIAVIIDHVMNHTSSQHPWFLESKDPSSPKRDWYIWTDRKESWKGPWGQEVWYKDGSDWYYAVFWDQMPDLNYRNPEVTAEMEKITAFWLTEVGVDGLRLDAVKHLVEDGWVQENTPETIAWMKNFGSFVKKTNNSAFIVSEIWSPTAQILPYIGSGVDSAFEFDLASAIITSAKTARKANAMSAMSKAYQAFPAGGFSSFIANHDQDRTMSQLLGSTDLAKTAASLLLLGPGVPFIYYGEEIGMTGTKPDEDIRRPMQWESPAGGFTSGTPWRPYDTTVETVSVMTEHTEKTSLLNHYRNLVGLRNTHEALRRGDFTIIETGSSQLAGFLRETDTESILVLVNLGRKAVAPVLASDSSLLKPGTAGRILTGTGKLSQPGVGDGGSFRDYAPVPEIGGFQTLVVGFKR